MKPFLKISCNIICLEALQNFSMKFLQSKGLHFWVLYMISEFERFYFCHLPLFKHFFVVMFTTNISFHFEYIVCASSYLVIVQIIFF